MTDNIKKFPGKKELWVEKLPENCKNTECYGMHEILITTGKMKTVTDFTTGEERNRRWGLAMQLTAIPEFDKVPVMDGFPNLLPKTEVRFFTADDVQELKARVMYEVTKTLDMMELSVKDPEEFMRRHRQNMAAIGAVEPFGTIDDTDDMN